MSADDVIRASVASMPLPTFPDQAFTLPPPLEKSRVAVVTTAGLMRHGEQAWGHDDSTFRVFDQSEKDIMVGHVSMTFDRVGISADLNVVFPVDRLTELAHEGIIGSVAGKHISFMGALRSPDLISTLIQDTGPAAAKILREDGVKVVVITPSCPACSRTVTILGHVLEAQGLSTIVLASNLEITKRAQPPRALFCDFPLGRPLGKPRDDAYQKQVLKAAFSLLQRQRGPVLEVFPDIIKDEADVSVVCPLPPTLDSSLAPEIDEALGLKNAWQRNREISGGTQIGRQVSVDEIPDAITRIIAIAAGTPREEVFATVDAMLQTAMDVRVYYEEAALGLSDHVPAARAAEAWFYQKTRTGDLFHRLVDKLNASGRAEELGMAGIFYLVPLSQSKTVSRNKAPWDKSPADPE